MDDMQNEAGTGLEVFSGIWPLETIQEQQITITDKILGTFIFILCVLKV